MLKNITASQLARWQAVPGEARPCVHGLLESMSTLNLEVDTSTWTLDVDTLHPRRLWCMYADLEESLGTLDSTKAVYERMIDLKVPHGISSNMIYMCCIVWIGIKACATSYAVFTNGL